MEAKLLSVHLTADGSHSSKLLDTHPRTYAGSLRIVRAAYTKVGLNCRQGLKRNCDIKTSLRATHSSESLPVQ
jgi:hypothetical protein